MCGVVAVRPWAPNPDQGMAFMRLFKESTIRGLHAFGAAQAHPEIVAVKSFDINEVFGKLEQGLCTIAHARYCTSGDWKEITNNQPILAAGYALAFNGVIHMGKKEEFEAEFGVQCVSDNDGEVFLRRMEKGQTPQDFIRSIKGSFAGVWLDSEGTLWAGRNARRPLWKQHAYDAEWYASTRDIFKRAGFPEYPFPVPVLEGVERAR